MTMFLRNNNNTMVIFVILLFLVMISDASSAVHNKNSSNKKLTSIVPLVNDWINGIQSNKRFSHHMFDSLFGTKNWKSSQQQQEQEQLQEHNDQKMTSFLFFDSIVASMKNKRFSSSSSSTSTSIDTYEQHGSTSSDETIPSTYYGTNNKRELVVEDDTPSFCDFIKSQLALHNVTQVLECECIENDPIYSIECSKQDLCLEHETTLRTDPYRGDYTVSLTADMSDPDYPTVSDKWCFDYDDDNNNAGMKKGCIITDGEIIGPVCTATIGDETCKFCQYCNFDGLLDIDCDNIPIDDGSSSWKSNVNECLDGTLEGTSFQFYSQDVQLSDNCKTNAPTPTPPTSSGRRSCSIGGRTITTMLVAITATMTTFLVSTMHTTI